MNSDELGVFGVVLAIVAMVIAISIGAKGCNDSDNAAYIEMAKQHCSWVRVGDGHEMRCPGYTNQQAIEEQ